MRLRSDAYERAVVELKQRDGLKETSFWYDVMVDIMAQIKFGNVFAIAND